MTYSVSARGSKAAAKEAIAQQVSGHPKVVEGLCNLVDDQAGDTVSVSASGSDQGASVSISSWTSVVQDRPAGAPTSAG